MKWPSFLVKYKVQITNWNINRNKKRLLNNHLVKEGGHMNQAALESLYEEFNNHKHFAEFADPNPYEFRTIKNRVDRFSMVCTAHKVGGATKVTIRTRMHKPMSHTPNPCIEVSVETFDSHFTENYKHRISEVSYEFMNSISPTTVLNPSGRSEASIEEIEKLIRLLRDLFSWVINDVIDWRS